MQARQHDHTDDYDAGEKDRRQEGEEAGRTTVRPRSARPTPTPPTNHMDPMEDHWWPPAARGPLASPTTATPATTPQEDQTDVPGDSTADETHHRREVPIRVRPARSRCGPMDDQRLKP